jgi:Ca-activated chloride channel family protein
MKRLLTLSLVSFWFMACASDGGGLSEPSGSSAVVQAGPQDIGEFRSIVAAGAVPELEVLDELGFFAEHKLDLPPATCGASVCVHPMLAVAPKFDGGNWSMAFVGMNTSVDASTLAKRPRHLIVIVDPLLGVAAPVLSIVIDSMRTHLGPDDRVSLIAVADGLTVLAEAEPTTALSDLVLPSDGPAANATLYSALAESLHIVDKREFESFEQRVLVFSGDTNLGPGLDDAVFFEDLAQEFAERRTAITVFTGAPSEPLNALVDVTAGNYYFVEGAVDLQNAVDVEGATAFVPIARDLRLTLKAAEGYRIGRIFGAPRARVNGDEAVLESSTAYVGARTASSDTTSGRRGGGGGWFVQLLSDRPPTGAQFEPAEAFTLSVEYEDAVTGERVHTESSLSTPLGVGQNPPPQTPFFSDQERGKPFMMVNMYLALATTTMLANENQCGAALAIEPMMTDAWEIFTELFPDSDIDADFALLQALTNNIRRSCSEPMAISVEVPMSCGYI